MERGFHINYENTPFLGTSKTAAHPNRLNWRCGILLARNQEAIRGKRILDLASHDGRFSYACLELGASHVTGVEGRQHLVESAAKNLEGLGYKPEHSSFIQSDVFDYLHEVKPKEFDTILCFGFLYHTMRQNELFAEISRIQATYFVLDTHIARGIFIGHPLVRLRSLVQMRVTPKRLAEEMLRLKAGEPCLVFIPETHVLEGATIDPIGLVAWPTKSYIELMFKSHGFAFSELYWSKKEIKDWTNIKDYKHYQRVSYIARLPQ